MDKNFMENEIKDTEEPVIILEEQLEEQPIALPEDDKKVIKIKISRQAALIIGGVIVVLVAVYLLKGLLIAATVNGSPIGRLTVINKLEKASGKNLLDSLINQKLVSKEAKAKNIVVSDEEIDTEIKNLEIQVTAQGTNLDAALALQGMNRDDLRQQIIFQKQVEKLVADKTAVTEAEVAKYITDNKINIPKGQEATANAQIKSELSNQKLNQAATSLLETLKSQAKIKYFVKY